MTQTAYNYSIYLISKRDYSIFKLTQKLKFKEYSQSEITEAIELLLEQNYLRENEYRRARIKQLLLKGYSETYISRKLEQENLERPSSEDFVDIRSEYQIDDSETIRSLVEKKLRNKVIPEDFGAKQKIKNKVMYFLMSKGYSFDQFKSIINEYF